MIDTILEKKPARKKALEYKTIRDLLISIKAAMYHWEGLPDTVRPEYLELYLALYGDAAICKDREGNWIAALVDRGGEPDPYGLGKTPIISTLNGYTHTYNIKYGDYAEDFEGGKCCICYNNNTKDPDQIIASAAEMLTESIISLYQNIIHSRYNPLYAVTSDVIKRAVEEKMGDIIAGKPVVIVADNILEDIETGRKPVESVHLTDVDKQDRIQYIAHCIDDVIRWILTMYGQAIQGNGKLAQQTVDEVNGTTSASFIIPEIGWRTRNSFASLLNKELGWEVSVTYNKPWTVEVEKYTEDVESIEGADPEPEKEPEEEPEKTKNDPDKQDENIKED